MVCTFWVLILAGSFRHVLSHHSSDERKSPSGVSEGGTEQLDHLLVGMAVHPLKKVSSFFTLPLLHDTAFESRNEQ